jgi:hypothetical protein
MKDEVLAAAGDIGLPILDHEMDEYAELLQRMETALQTVSKMDGKFISNFCEDHRLLTEE